MSKAKQTSESIELGILLALSGGIMDAYSYMARGKVFANAQTGNMLLFGIYLSGGRWNMGITLFLSNPCFYCRHHACGYRAYQRKYKVALETVVGVI